jgi:restriction system protein
VRGARVWGLHVPEDRDPYEVLGVDHNATQEEVEAAYRRLIRLTHPDAGGTNLLFRQVKEAYDTLSDPTRRAEHDRGGRLRAEPDPASRAGSGWKRVDDPGVPGNPPPGGGFPPPRPGPTSPPGPRRANPGPPFSDWGPGRPRRGGNRGGPPGGGAAPGRWDTAATGTYSPRDAALGSRASSWRSRPWLIAAVAGVLFLVLGTQVAGFALLGFIFLVVGLVAAAGSRRVQARLAFRHAQVAHADYMDGTAFEHFAAEVLRANGYQVEPVGKVGDFGADLVITGPGGRSVVQLKRYRSHVGVDAVREAAAARAHYGTTGAIVLTNSYFTHQAVALARSNRVELWDRSTLVRLASRNEPLAPAALTVFGLELAAGIAVIGRFLLGFLVAASTSSAKRRRPARRRRR